MGYHFREEVLNDLVNQVVNRVFEKVTQPEENAGLTIEKLLEIVTKQREEYLNLAMRCIEKLGGKVTIPDPESEREPISETAWMTKRRSVLMTDKDAANKSIVYRIYYE